MNHQYPIEILHVEDNPGDARLIMEAFREGRVKNNLHVVYDGEAATDFLYKRKKYSHVPSPDLIILDLNLPRKTGQEILAEIKNDDNLKRIPVVIMTISRAEDDIIKSYNLHANCYIIKPLNLDKFLDAVRSIEDFWLSTVKLPARNY